MGRAMSVVVARAGAGDRATAETVGADLTRESSPAARRAAWAAVILLGWVLSYSIGWQKGWIVGNGDTDSRFKQLNQTLLEGRSGTVRAADSTVDAGDDSAESA